MRQFKFIFFSFVLSAWLSSTALASRCNDLLLQRAQAQVDWSQRIDWVDIRGHAVVPFQAVLSPRDRIIARSLLNETSGSEFSFGNLNNRRKIFSQTLLNFFGYSIAASFENYVQTLIDKISRHSPRKFKMDIFVRTERGFKVLEGHSHAEQTLSISKAEMGPASWYVESINAKGRTYLKNPEDLMVFTDEYHGTPMSSEPRLLVLIFVRFEFTNSYYSVFQDRQQTPEPINNRY